MFSLLFLMILLIFHIIYVDTSHFLAEILSDQLLDGATAYTSSNFNITFGNGDDYRLGETVLLPEDIYSIEFGGISYSYSMISQSVTMDKEIFARKNFTVHNIVIEKDDLLPQPLF